MKEKSLFKVYTATGTLVDACQVDNNGSLYVEFEHKVFEANKVYGKDDSPGYSIIKNELETIQVRTELLHFVHMGIEINGKTFFARKKFNPEEKKGIEMAESKALSKCLSNAGLGYIIQLKDTRTSIIQGVEGIYKLFNELQDKYDFKEDFDELKMKFTGIYGTLEGSIKEIDLEELKLFWRYLNQAKKNFEKPPVPEPKVTEQQVEQNVESEIQKGEERTEKFLKENPPVLNDKKNESHEVMTFDENGDELLPEQEIEKQPEQMNVFQGVKNIVQEEVTSIHEGLNQVEEKMADINQNNEQPENPVTYESVISHLTSMMLTPKMKPIEWGLQMNDIWSDLQNGLGVPASTIQTVTKKILKLDYIPATRDECLDIDEETWLKLAETFKERVEAKQKSEIRESKKELAEQMKKDRERQKKKSKVAS